MRPSRCGQQPCQPTVVLRIWCELCKLSRRTKACSRRPSAAADTGVSETSERTRMALIIFGKSRCSLCGTVLAAGEDLVATTHFIADETDPLWRYSDSGMHRRCFLAWEHRPNFVAKYNAIAGQHVWGNGTRERMELDGTIVVEPVRPPTAR